MCIKHKYFIYNISDAQQPIVKVPSYLEIEEARKLHVTCEVTNAADFPNATMSFRWTK